MVEEIAIEARHIGAGGTIHEDAVEDVHAYHLVVKALDVTGRRIAQLFPVVVE